MTDSPDLLNALFDSLAWPSLRVLLHTQKQSLDVTEWLAWFLATLYRAVDQAHQELDAVLAKTRFWQRWAVPSAAPLNERQVKLVNRLLDGFEGKLTSSKWAAIVKCSPDTALRDITDLLARGVSRKSDAGGRSTSYELNDASKQDDLREITLACCRRRRPTKALEWSSQDRAPRAWCSTAAWALTRRGPGSSEGRGRVSQSLGRAGCRVLLRPRDPAASGIHPEAQPVSPLCPGA